MKNFIALCALGVVSVNAHKHHRKQKQLQAQQLSNKMLQQESQYYMQNRAAEDVQMFLNQQQEPEVLAELVEVESGAATDRPVLESALALCRKHKATEQLQMLTEKLQQRRKEMVNQERVNHKMKIDLQMF